MSSSEDNSSEEPYRSSFRNWTDEGGSVEGRFNKKRRGRACDLCRRRKIKCDGTENVDRSCTNCIISKSKCTYIEPSRRSLSIPLEELKDRIKTLETILSELFPRADVQAKDISAESLRRSLLIPELSLSPSHGSGEIGGDMESSGSPVSEEANRIDDVAATTQSEVEQGLKPIHSKRFHGQSSGAALLSDALNMKLASETAQLSTSLSHKGLLSQYTAGIAAIANSYYLDRALNLFLQGPSPLFTFPPEDLMDSLISLFFDKMHWNLPILHMPTFCAQYRSKIYKKDTDFATILLLVCAVASRYSDDTRVLPTCEQLRNEIESEKWLHAGLDYYAQVFPFLTRPPTQSPTLFDLQKIALACVYLQGSKSAPYEWSLSGLGVRLALEAGAHRKQHDTTLTVESQLWSRAFWALVALDRLGSASTGRPWAIQDEDIDVDFPLGVDDAYWDPPDPNDAWKQPPDKPALAECFRSMLKLLEILAFTLRTVYSTDKSRVMLGLVGPDWQQRVVSEIDSALNKWVDSMPDHLRWNPQQQNTILLNQSALLNCLYHQVQTMVHRPFISLKTSSTALSFTSLAVCTNAARACSHILEVHLARGDPLPYLTSCAFMSGIVLLFNIWGVRKLSIRPDRERHMQDVIKCLAWLKAHSLRWSKAKFAWNVLRELLRVRGLPQPRSNPLPEVTTGTKRSRNSSGLEVEVAAQGEGPTSSHLKNYDPTTQEKVLVSVPQVVTTESVDSSALYNNGEQLSQASDYWRPMESTMVQTHMPVSTVNISPLPIYSEPRYPTPSERAPSHAMSGTGTYMATSGDVSKGKLMTGERMGTDNVPSWAIVQGMGSAENNVKLPQYPTSSSSSFEGENVLANQPNITPGRATGDSNMFKQSSPETLLNQDTLDMWSTAPTSFEAQDWGNFAQEFQFEEQQLRFSDIFLDAIS